MSFADNAKGFRLLDPTIDKITTSRDVKFLNEHDCIQNNVTKHSIKKFQDNEVILPSILEEELKVAEIEEEPHTTDHSDKDETDISNNEASSDISAKRGRGRPRIVRTGLRGRPKKNCHTLTTQETGMFAEVSVKETISGPAVEE